MPGAGKTTIGMEISDTLSCPWIDTDQIIEKKIKMKLAEYIEANGVKKFKKLEEKVLLDLDAVSSIISTGGSVIYYDDGMKHLKTLGKLVYLNVDYNVIEERIMLNPNRGIAIVGNLDLKKLYDERTAKYSLWADYTITCANKTAEDICLEIINVTQD